MGRAVRSRDVRATAAVPAGDGRRQQRRRDVPRRHSDPPVGQRADNTLKGDPAMRERWVLRLAAVALAAAPLLRAQAAGATTVTVRAASTRAAAGQSVSIPIDLRGARDIGAMHLELGFDAAILQPDTVERGALLGGGNALMESN
ncbi:MAG: hypothetical protein FIB01_16605, partial [Gemmatimonadetes bacterium]|nr:hypothetical protein [Gemmatimonadota bacterium]